LYAAIKSKKLNKVKWTFNKDIWYPWMTRAVLVSTKEIYEYLTSQGIILDFSYITKEPVGASPSN
jgi:hypothetical protein